MGSCLHPNMVKNANFRIFLDFRILRVFAWQPRFLARLPRWQLAGKRPLLTTTVSQIVFRMVKGRNVRKLDLNFLIENPP